MNELAGVTVRRTGREARADMVVVPVMDGPVRRALHGVRRALARAIEQRARATGFRGDGSEQLVVHGGDATAVLLGMGKGEPARADWVRAGARARREVEAAKAKRVEARLDGPSAVAAAFVEGFHLAGYRFEDQKGRPENRPAPRLVLTGSAAAAPDTSRLVEDTRALVECVLAARDLVNQPPSVATPSFLAEFATTAAKRYRGLEVEVWGESRMAKRGVAGVPAVARGTHEPPRFITLRWAPTNPRKRVAIVGKAITFDSGGLSLKPAKSMETMKYDMAGGAAALATVMAAARLQLPVAVTAYVPATENMPGGRAQKPGDVIRYANGKTVEVLNTDAEGRLVLADGLVIASREKPDAIVDLATLTGSARVALGVRYAAVLGTDQQLIDALRGAGDAVGERLWQLPLADEYKDDLKSAVADLKNVGGGPEGGTIIGALFLREFVDGVPWAHLDIAGPAFADRDWPEVPKGGTGFGVRLLVAYLRSLAAEPS
ncbi:MAG TPA: leucyl aminopeptidase [Candidatus Limnocylindria bacterium]|nr:leucyl aminopeptidase [Candidatus Limnocylindria bacterium]